MAKNDFCVSVRESLLKEKKEVCEKFKFSEFIAYCLILYRDSKKFREMLSKIVIAYKE